MKKLLLAAAIAIICSASASAQLLPGFQFGLKGGINLTSISKSVANTFDSDNRAGYIAGLWARVGGAGLYFQPELYLTSKNVTLHSGTFGPDGDVVTVSNKARFTSIDLPLLIGTKFGVLGSGLRINTGPLISFAINKDQNTGEAFTQATRLNYKDQNYAWQFGVGADVSRLSVDLRYEAGLNRVSTDSGDKTRINLFNLTLGYRLFSL